MLFHEKLCILCFLTRLNSANVVFSGKMRTVLMALVLLWWCHLAIILPVILGQQSRDNWDREEEQGNFIIRTLMFFTFFSFHLILTSNYFVIIICISSPFT